MTYIRGVDTGLTEDTRLTEIRQSGPFSNFNSTLHNLRVLKYKFEIVTIVQVDHILNFKKNRTQLILHVEGYFFLNSKYDLLEQLLVSQICI